MELPLKSTTSLSREELRRRLGWLDDAADHLHQKLVPLVEARHRRRLSEVQGISDSVTNTSGNGSGRRAEGAQHPAAAIPQLAGLSLNPEHGNRSPRSIDQDQSPIDARPRSRSPPGPAPELHALLISPNETQASASPRAQANAAPQVEPSIAIPKQILARIRLFFVNVYATRLVRIRREHVKAAGIQLMEVRRKDYTRLYHIDHQPEPAPYNLPPQARATLAAMGADLGNCLLETVERLAYLESKLIDLSDDPPVWYNEVRREAIEIAGLVRKTIAEYAVEAAANAANSSSRPSGSEEGTGSSENDAGPSRSRPVPTEIPGADTGTRSPPTTAPTTGNVAQDHVATTNWPLRTSFQFQSLQSVCVAWLQEHLRRELTDQQRSQLSAAMVGFFKTLVNHEVTVELKNDISIRGTLKSVDQYLNIKLDDIMVLEDIKYPHLSSVKNIFIRGSVVRYVHLPAAAVDTPLLEDATRREAAQAAQKAKSG
ncbi:hypothetical protein MBLNU457_g0748t1 [Dothideomycetes sp. NU457]